MLRRLFLAYLGLVPVLSLASGAPTGALSVVEIVNFSCSRCRELESYRATIEEATRTAGGRFVFAPVSWEGQGIARDLTYFAARLRGPNVEAFVRKALFEASQDHNLPLEDLPQVIGWLSQTGSASLAIDWAELSATAKSASTLDAAFRAGRLAKLAAIPSVPSFVILKGDTVIHVVNYDLDGGSASKVAASVIEKLKGLNF